MTLKEKAELLKMFKWSILQLCDNHPDTIIFEDELVSVVKEAWHDLVEDGDIVLED